MFSNYPSKKMKYTLNGCIKKSLEILSVLTQLI